MYTGQSARKSTERRGARTLSFPGGRVGGNDATDWGEEPGNDLPRRTHAGEDRTGHQPSPTFWGGSRRKSARRGSVPEVDEAWFGAGIRAAVADPRPTRHTRMRTVRFGGRARVRSAPDSTGGILLMGREFFLSLKEPAIPRKGLVLSGKNDV